MIGPNGSGKSSVFDALYQYKKSRGILAVGDDPYFNKFDSSGQSKLMVEVGFYTGSPQNYEDWDRIIHIRTSYRNDLVEDLSSYDTRNNSIVSEYRFRMLADNDQVVAPNFGRILNQWIERSSATGRREENIGGLQDEIFGELRDAIAVLFSDSELVLTNLGSLDLYKVFQFNKGTSHGLSYVNLSSGEKASLDLILDIIVAKSEFNDTVFCIDEPEAHIHTKLQGPLLKQLYNLIPENSQLWIATHSIGMVRKAQDLWRAGRNEGKDSVVFLDFGSDDLDFDGKAIIVPTLPNPDFWVRTYEIALGDLAKLVAPKRIVLCESAGFDADCYNKIFGVHHPETRFIPIGSDQDVGKADENLIPVIQAIAQGAEILRLRDRDDADDEEIEESKENGIRTLSRRNIEGFLLDDEVLLKFCEYHNIPGQIQNLIEARQTALNDSIANGKPPDDLKPTAQKVHVTARNALSPTPVGNRKTGFMRNHLAPRIQPGMDVYEELHDTIFGEGPIS